MLFRHLEGLKKSNYKMIERQNDPSVLPLFEKMGYQIEDLNEENSGIEEVLEFQEGSSTEEDIFLSDFYSEEKRRITLKELWGYMLLIFVYFNDFK